MREYQFDLTNKSTRTNNECFNEEDIINIYPLIKQVPPKVIRKIKINSIFFCFLFFKAN
jgi:hypothetical protein